MGFYIRPEHQHHNDSTPDDHDYDVMMHLINQQMDNTHVQQMVQLINGCVDDSSPDCLQDMSMLKQILFDTPSVDEHVTHDQFDWKLDDEQSDHTC